MKVSLFINENIEQFNLTPENDYEKNMLKRMASKYYEVKIKKGEFYLCNAGYELYSTDTDTYMIVIKEKSIE